jgi:hypothetical protein
LQGVAMHAVGALAVKAEPGVYSLDQASIHTRLALGAWLCPGLGMHRRTLQPLLVWLLHVLHGQWAHHHLQLGVGWLACRLLNRPLVARLPGTPGGGLLVRRLRALQGVEKGMPCWQNG